MKRFICILAAFVLSSNTLNAQTDLSSFQDDVLRNFAIKDKQFTKRAKKILLSSIHVQKSDSIKVINIPVIYSSKKAAKILRERNINKNEFFKYLDVSSMSFDECIIINDTVASYIIPSANPSKKSECLKVLDDYRKSKAKEIININPEVIFTIYNIPRCCWYIKDTELYVLAYQNDVFKSYRAIDYLRNYLTEEQISYIYHKKVVVISGE